jgi:hypothetical protein
VRSAVGVVLVVHVAVGYPVLLYLLAGFFWEDMTRVVNLQLRRSQLERSARSWARIYERGKTRISLQRRLVRG